MAERYPKLTNLLIGSNSGCFPREIPTNTKIKKQIKSITWWVRFLLCSLVYKNKNEITNQRIGIESIASVIRFG